MRCITPLALSSAVTSRSISGPSIGSTWGKSMPRLGLHPHELAPRRYYPGYMSDQTTSGPRSVKIGADERTGWSSDRPRGRDGQDRPPRPIDLTTRCRLLKPSDRMRYSPGSLVVVVSADPVARDR